jgi:transcriptional regulator with XRE-family HTH domain
MAVKIPSLNARRALESLGANIKTARLKRRFSVKSFAGRIGVSERTVMRLEKGDDGVSIGTLVMACLVLGELDRISDFLDMGTDNTGLLLDKERLPKRIGKKRKAAPTNTDRDQLKSGNDEEGVAF